MEFKKGMKIHYNGRDLQRVKVPLAQIGTAEVLNVRAGWIEIRMDETGVRIHGREKIMQERCRPLDKLQEGETHDT